MSVRKRNNSWVADWSDAKRIRRTKTFAKKSDALAYEREQRKLAQRGEFFDPSTLRKTVGELYAPWMRTKSNLKPKTLQSYSNSWNNVVEFRWGNVQLRHVTIADVQEWIATCTSAHGRSMGASSVRNAYRVLKMVLDFAVDQGYITKNPAVTRSGTNRNLLPRTPHKGNEILLSRNEVKKLAEHAEPYADLILLLATIGLRFNEAAALKGADVDIDRNKISVRRTFSDVNGRLIEQSPKNGKPREVLLPTSLRSNLIERKIRAGSAGYIFPSPHGDALRYPNFYRRIWKPAVKQSGISHNVKIHELRHTAASWLIQQGCGLPLLSRMLGHADPAFTLRTYIHLFEDEVGAFGEKLDRLDTA